MRVVSNGYAFDQLQANPEARDRLRQDWGLEPDIFAVGLVGRFNPAKDHQTFVEAAGKVAQFHTTARFILIGRGIEPSNGELMTWIRATGYVDRFLLLGERADVPDCLAAMDGFCLSSRTEGFPNVVAEAMAMALPCVVTDVGDAAYLLGGHGWVVPKEDPWALSAALAALIRLGPEERIRLGRAARTRVRETFTVSQMAEQFANIYSCVP
jgi:glycosyltransferase involved in cell wall biosynthesis